MDVAHDPSTPPVPLHLDIQNNLAESNVTLDTKYRGTFDVQTKLASAVVEEGEPQSIPDPFGEDRPRVYVYDIKSDTRTLGWVGWGKRPKKWDPMVQGHVDIVSSLSSVSLQLGGVREV